TRRPPLTRTMATDIQPVVLSPVTGSTVADRLGLGDGVGAGVGAGVGVGLGQRIGRRPSSGEHVGVGVGDGVGAAVSSPLTQSPTRWSWALLPMLMGPSSFAPVAMLKR